MALKAENSEMKARLPAIAANRLRVMVIPRNRHYPKSSKERKADKAAMGNTLQQSQNPDQMATCKPDRFNETAINHIKVQANLPIMPHG